LTSLCPHVLPRHPRSTLFPYTTLFRSIINDEHKGLTKSLVDSHRLALSKSPEQEKPELAISAQLNKDADSPWYGAVNTGGISKSTPGSKRKITLRTFHEANKVLISGPRIKYAEYATKYEAAKNF